MADKQNPPQNFTKASSDPVNIEELRERLPNTNELLKAGNEEYRKLSAQFDNNAGASGGSAAVLTQWEQMLTGSMDPQELRTQSAEAMRKFAESEDIPPPEQTNDIDFREVYKQIANAMEGKPITADKGVTAVLQKCLIETAKRSKAQMMNPDFLNFMNNLNVADKDTSPAPPQPTNDPNLEILRSFASQKSYNPFNVPEQLLTLITPASTEDVD